jgi:predicted DNA-binding antitoxin AbrB/MazE fold protein
MMATDEMAIDAIYRDGVLKPLAKYKGILAGKDNFSLEEIEEAVQSVMDSRLGKTVANLDQDGK